MPATDQKDKGKSFSVSKSEAFQRFTQRKLRQDESVDALTTDLRRLLDLAGHKDGGDNDAVVIEQILAGIPVHLSQQVRLSFAGKELTVESYTDAIRELLRAVPLGDVGAAAAKSSSDSSCSKPHAHALVMCFRCGEVGHVRRNCPQRSMGQKNAFSNA